jgi:hypothetical protein
MASQTISPAPRLSWKHASDPAQARWSLATRIAFRFAFAYLSILCVNILSVVVMITIYFTTSKLDSGFIDPLWRAIVPWFGRHVVHVHGKIQLIGNGDRMFDWVLVLLMLTLASVATLVWSALDRRRPNYARLYAWLRVAVRLALAMALIVYGADKVVPLQFGLLTPSRLAMPVGALSPEGMLWAFMAASTGYTIMSGILEAAGAVLLTIPPLANVGALLTIVVMSNVFALNVFYGVPVKIYSFSYLVMAVFLILPELRRLADVLVLNQPTQPISVTPLFGNRGMNRFAFAAQLLIGGLFLLINLYGTYGTYRKRQQVSAIKPPLYGIWNVNDFSMQGDSPQFSGDTRWRQLIFDRPGMVLVEGNGGEYHALKLAFDGKQNILTLTGSRDSKFKANLHVQRPTSGDLVLDGEIDGNPIHLTLHRVDETKFPLTTPGVRWIR